MAYKKTPSTDTFAQYLPLHCKSVLFAPTAHSIYTPISEDATPKSVQGRIFLPTETSESTPHAFWKYPTVQLALHVLFRMIILFSLNYSKECSWNICFNESFRKLSMSVGLIQGSLENLISMILMAWTPWTVKPKNSHKAPLEDKKSYWQMIFKSYVYWIFFFMQYFWIPLEELPPPLQA